MSKTSICIEMLSILSTGRTIKISELAKILETSSRNIIEYKKELEAAGYFITSVPGRYGGYRLEKISTFPTINFTEDEKSALKSGFSFTLNHRSFLPEASFYKAIGKISANCQLNFDGSELYTNKAYLYKDKDALLKIFSLLEKAIDKRIVILINDEMVYPYQLVLHNDLWYLMFWDDVIYGFNHLPLHQVLSIKLLDKHFRCHSFADIHQYYDEFGFKPADETYQLELLVTNKANQSFKDMVYGKKQVVNPIDDNKSIVKLQMSGKDKIMRFILSFQCDVKVISPLWVIEELKSYTRFLNDTYKD